MSIPLDLVSFVVALLKVVNNFPKAGFLISYPTIRGTLAKLPARMDFVGKSVITLPSTTGWNVLYPEAVLQTLSVK